MSRSTARAPRALRPTAATALNTCPYARAASASKGSGSKAASVRWSRSWRRARSAGSDVAWGPAASSAKVRALTATSEGSRSGSMRSRSTTTEVSRSPRLNRAELVTSHVLRGDGVQITTKASQLHRRCATKDLGNGFGARESVPPEGGELADRDAVSGHDVGVTAVEPPHDLPALVPQLSLGDLPSHGDDCSTPCYNPLRVARQRPRCPATVELAQLPRRWVRRRRPSETVEPPRPARRTHALCPLGWVRRPFRSGQARPAGSPVRTSTQPLTRPVRRPAGDPRGRPSERSTRP